MLIMFLSNGSFTPRSPNSVSKVPENSTFDVVRKRFLDEARRRCWLTFGGSWGWMMFWLVATQIFFLFWTPVWGRFPFWRAFFFLINRVWYGVGSTQLVLVSLEGVFFLSGGMWLDYLVVGVKCSWGKLTSGVNDSMIRWWLKCCPPEKGTSYGDFVVSMLVLGGVIDFVCFGWVLLTTGWQEELLQWQCELESPWILEFVFTKKQGIYIQCHENKLLLNLGSRVDIWVFPKIMVPPNHPSL